MKNILICLARSRIANCVLKDIGDALAHHNLSITYENFTLDIDPNDEYEIFNELAERVYRANPDFIIMNGIEGIIPFKITNKKHFFEILKIPFLSLNFESPVKTLYRAIWISESNLCHIAINERAYIDNLRSFGFSNVFYFPSATNPSRFSPGRGTFPAGFSQDADIAFIGHLRNEERLTWRKFNIAVSLIPHVLKEAEKGELPLNKIILKGIEQFVLSGELTRADFSPAVTAEIFNYCCEEINSHRRIDIVNSLKEYRINAGGEGWEMKSSDRFCSVKRVDYEKELPAVYEKTPITLGISSSEGISSCPLSIFDCFASGGFILHDFREDISNFFKPGDEIDLYITKKELHEKIKFYLDNPSKREDMAAKARKKIIKEHTWDRRVIKIIEELGRIEGRSHVKGLHREKGMDPSVSAVVIVRNEEKLLSECLQSISHEVDDIVVVDTGSTDRTVDVAREMGAQVFFAEWINDFSSIRNFAMHRAAGDWILVIDADEKFSPDKKNTLKQLLKDVPDETVGLQVEVRTKGLEKSSLAVRLIRNGKGVVFEGAVNEKVIIPQGKQVERSECIINHSRVVDHETSSEIAETVKKGNSTPHMLFALMNAMKTGGDVDQAIHYALLFLKSVDTSVIMHSDYREAFYVLCSSYMEKGEFENVLENAFVALKEDPRDRELWYLVGKSYYEMENYDRVFLAYRTFMGIPESRDHAGYEGFTHLMEMIKKYDAKYSIEQITEISLSVAILCADGDPVDQTMENSLSYADEIIVGNWSGEDESSIKVSANNTVHVYSIAWEDSFAKALNRLKEYASKDWVLFLYPGEWMDNQSIYFIKQLISLNEKAGRDAFRIICDRYENNRIFCRTPLVRLVRKESGFAFEDDVFGSPETIDDGIPTIDIVANNSDTGENNISPVNNKRLSIIKSRFDQAPETPLYLYYLGLIYAETQNWPTAVVYVQRCIGLVKEEDNAEHKELRRRAAALMIIGLLELGYIKNAQEHVQEMIAEFPEFLDSFYLLIMVYAFQGRYDGKMDDAISTYHEKRNEILKGAYSEVGPLYGLYQHDGIRILHGGIRIVNREDGCPLIKEGLYNNKGFMPLFVMDFFQSNIQNIAQSEELEDLLKTHKDSVHCLLLLLHINAYKGDDKERLRHLTILEDISPFHRGEAAYLKAEIHISRSDRTNALEYYIRAVDEFQQILNTGVKLPSDMLVHYATSLERVGRITEAISIYEVLLKLCSEGDAAIISEKIRHLKDYLKID